MLIKTTNQKGHIKYKSALPLNLLKSMTQDIDLKVTQVGRDGTA